MERSQVEQDARAEYNVGVVDSLIVNHERTVEVLEGGVGGQDSVVWLDDGTVESEGSGDR